MSEMIPGLLILSVFAAWLLGKRGQRGAALQLGALKAEAHTWGVPTYPDDTWESLNERVSDARRAVPASGNPLETAAFALRAQRELQAATRKPRGTGQA